MAESLTIGAIRFRKKLAEDDLIEYWTAKDHDLDRHVLIHLHKDATGDEASPIEFQRLSFIDAARTMAAFDHRHIAKLLTYGRMEDGRPYLTTPRYRFRLREFFADDEGEDFGRAERWVFKLTYALADIHTRNYVHGRLSQDAVFLSGGRDEIKLAGFHGAAGLENTDRPSPANDVFQLGLLAYRLLVGRYPGAAAERPSAANPAISKALEGWIVRCLAQNAERRPADGAEALAALVAIRGENES